MTLVRIVALIALAAPLVQIAAMGFIGYPIARRRPGGMAAFRRSGFGWWLGVLTAISLLALIATPAVRAWNYPAGDGGLREILYGALVALVVCLVIELAGERVILGGGDEERRARASAKYEGALPPWARAGAPQYSVLVVVAVLEEFVFRAVALGGLWLAWDLSKPWAAGLVVVAFGLSHWYYGFRQVTLKLMVGSALVWSAFTGGWIAAALAHAALNLCLTAVSARRRASGGELTR